MRLLKFLAAALAFSCNRAPPPVPDPPCILDTTGLRNITLFPDAVSAQAMRDVVSAADGLRMLDKPGVFDVPVGTACALVERGPTVSRVRVVAGEHAGATGWIRTDWIRDGVK